MSELRAVLFDMDGTLTDSEKLWTIALDRTAAELGGSLGEEARHEMVGHDMWSSVDILQTDVGSSRPPQEVARLLTDYTAELFAEPLPWRPGAQQLLAAVQEAGLAMALVTATHRTLVELALNTLGHSTFGAIVCGDEVAHVKPHPEPYRRAMELLGVRPEESLVIEDSPNGSASGLAAGLPVLVVPCDTAVPPRDGMTFRDSLEGLTVTNLRAIHAGSAG
ncbi:MAG: HAD family phosphatase [Nakamurella sp.]